MQVNDCRGWPSASPCDQMDIGPSVRPFTDDAFVKHFRQLAACRRWATARLYAAALDLSNKRTVFIGVFFGNLHLNYSGRGSLRTTG